ncbi:hypothetical protein KBD18_02130 [Patescibacteria group bacterium]|nr:hypothetical protein [Patescibacteria group bacterium]
MRKCLLSALLFVLGCELSIAWWWLIPMCSSMLIELDRVTVTVSALFGAMQCTAFMENASASDSDETPFFIITTPVWGIVFFFWTDRTWLIIPWVIGMIYGIAVATLRKKTRSLGKGVAVGLALSIGIQAFLFLLEREWHATAVAIVSVTAIVYTCDLWNVGSLFRAAIRPMRALFRLMRTPIEMRRLAAAQVATRDARLLLERAEANEARLRGSFTGYRGRVRLSYVPDETVTEEGTDLTNGSEAPAHRIAQ